MDLRSTTVTASHEDDRHLHKELLDRLVFETLLTDISAKFVSLPADQIDCEIEAAQKSICDCLGLDHSSLWQISPDDPGKIALSHLYRSDERSLPPPPRKMDGSEFFPWCLATVNRNELICIPDTSQVPPEAARDKETWQHFQVKSTLGIPLCAGGGPVFGVLSFDSTRRKREFSEELANRLQLVAQVFANALLRKFTEQKLRESESRLSLAADSANAGLWTLNGETGVIWATDAAYALLGLPSGDPLDVGRMLDLIHPQDRASVQTALAYALATGEEGTVEYRVVRPDGSTRWLVSRGRRHSRGEQQELLMGVTIEVTERKCAESERAELAGRLLHAQEAEAARIARELHDDLGQRIMVLGVRLGRAIALAEPSTPQVVASFQQLREEVVGIGTRIGSLSHQLHSCELDYLGLSFAAEALCHTVAEQHEIQVNCFASIPTRLENEVELCLYRILQEALNNATKHGKATAIEVTLESKPDAVHLFVVDDGCGFDPATAAPGLGLISMRERIRLMRGAYSIQSEPGKGTMLRATVPLPKAP